MASGECQIGHGNVAVRLTDEKWIPLSFQAIQMQREPFLAIGTTAFQA